MKQDGRLITFSWRIYRLLLRLYPTAFRQTFGREMALVFRDQCRRVRHQGGVASLVQFWMTALIDLLTTAFVEHLLETIQMPMRIIIGLCGFVGALGGLSLLIMLYIVAWGGGLAYMPLWHASFWYYPLSYALPLAVGTVGLYLTQGGKHEIRSKIGFGLALIGSVMMALDVLLFDGWLGQSLGMALHAVGLLLFGLDSHGSGMFLHRRRLLIVIGSFSLVLLLLLPGIQGEISGVLFLLLLFIYGIGWVLLGIMLALAKRQAVSDLRPVV